MTEICSIALAIVSVAILCTCLVKGKLNGYVMLLGGASYAIYLSYVLLIL